MVKYIDGQGHGNFSNGPQNFQKDKHQRPQDLVEQVIFDCELQLNHKLGDFGVEIINNLIKKLKIENRKSISFKLLFFLM